MIQMTQNAVEVEPMSEAECWAAIDHAGQVMSVPGMMQSELKNDPKLGAEFVANSKKILHILVDNFDAGVSPGDSDEELAVIDELNNLFLNNQVVQNKYMIAVLTGASVAMQQLDISDMITHIEPVSASDGVTEAGVEELKGLESEGRSAGMAKIDPRIMSIMSAGINAAGGQVEFAKLQHQVAQGLPNEFRESPEVMFTAQMIGAVMTAISSRSATRDMTLGQIRSTIEMVVGAKQALTLANMTAYHMKREELVRIMLASTEHHINNALKRTEDNIAEEKIKVDVDMTHIAGAKPTSFVFEGNRTVN